MCGTGEQNFVDVTCNTSQTQENGGRVAASRRANGEAMMGTRAASARSPYVNREGPTVYRSRQEGSTSPLRRAGEHAATRPSRGKFADGAAKQNSPFVMREIRLRGAITGANELTEH